MQPNVQYSRVGQAEANYTGYYPVTEQFPPQAINFSPLPSGGHTAPNNQGASPLWTLGNYWISYAEQDELHLTIALRRSHFA
jgi:hypothetical protein